MKISWAISELSSPREIKNMYLGDALTRAQLIQIWERARGKYLGRYLTNIEDFTLGSWTLEEIASVRILPLFSGSSGMRLGEFAAVRGPFEDKTDPRYAVEQSKADETGISSQAPITLGINEENLILIDGYTRAIAFIKTGDPQARIEVLVPVRNE